MRYLDVNLKRIEPADVKSIVGSFQAGAVVVTPTDTIYGLSCLASNGKAVRKIYNLKKRDPRKPVLILVASLTMLKKYAHLSNKQIELLKELWFESTIPTTVVLKSRNNLPKESEGPDGSLAIRLPKSDFLIKILRGVKEPLVSTSLNVSGQKNINNLKKINNHFLQESLQPDLIIRAGKSPKKQSSRIVDLRGGEIKIIRK